jgi:hypothetical protein
LLSNATARRRRRSSSAALPWGLITNASDTPRPCIEYTGTIARSGAGGTERGHGRDGVRGHPPDPVFLMHDRARATRREGTPLHSTPLDATPRPETLPARDAPHRPSLARALVLQDPTATAISRTAHPRSPGPED